MLFFFNHNSSNIITLNTNILLNRLCCCRSDGETSHGHKANEPKCKYEEWYKKQKGLKKFTNDFPC